MITHYGLFWSERDVFWGRPKNAGQLLGREKTPLGRRGAPSKAERDTARDYRDFVGLYCLYGEGELLYIGEAGLGTKSSLFSRLKQHRTGPMAGRWDAFSWFGRETCVGKTEVKAALGQLEAITISIINPGFNKQSGTFSGATQVYQVPHESSEGDMETKLARLAAQIESLRSKE
jgi:hypothetical protein